MTCTNYLKKCARNEHIAINIKHRILVWAKVEAEFESLPVLGFSAAKFVVRLNWRAIGCSAATTMYVWPRGKPMTKWPNFCSRGGSAVPTIGMLPHLVENLCQLSGGACTMHGMSGLLSDGGVRAADHLTASRLVNSPITLAHVEANNGCQNSALTVLRAGRIVQH